MDIDVRKAVMDNLTNSSKEDIKKTIVDAINMKEEITLPGLGVLFEVMWQKSDETFKDQILTKLV